MTKERHPFLHALKDMYDIKWRSLDRIGVDNVSAEQLQVDKCYLRAAYRYAAEHSDDPIAQNGVVIVRNNLTYHPRRIILFGTNRLPDGLEKTEKRLMDKATKLMYITHAERDTIYQAAKNGIALDQAVMIGTWITCHECADAIINAGIREAVGHTGPEEFYVEVREKKKAEAAARGDPYVEPPKSVWQQSVKIGLEKLIEAGVRLRFVSGKIGGVKIQFARREWRP